MNLTITVQFMPGITVGHLVQQCNEEVLFLSPFADEETKAFLLNNLSKVW